MDDKAILSEIKDFRKDVKTDIKELASKIDGQNRKIISSEKDIEHLQKDVDNLHKSFRDFRDNKVDGLIEEKIENSRNKIGFAMIMKILFG